MCPLQNKNCERYPLLMKNTIICPPLHPNLQTQPLSYSTMQIVRWHCWKKLAAPKHVSYVPHMVMRGVFQRKYRKSRCYLLYFGLFYVFIWNLTPYDRNEYDARWVMTWKCKHTPWCKICTYTPLPYFEPGHSSGPTTLPFKFPLLITTTLIFRWTSPETNVNFCTPTFRAKCALKIYRFFQRSAVYVYDVKRRSAPPPPPDTYICCPK